MCLCVCVSVCVYASVCMCMYVCVCASAVARRLNNWLVNGNSRDLNEMGERSEIPHR